MGRLCAPFFAPSEVLGSTDGVRVLGVPGSRRWMTRHLMRSVSGSSVYFRIISALDQKHNYTRVVT